MAHQHGLATAPPSAWLRLEHAGKQCSAIAASPVLRQMPLGQIEPVAADQQRSAAMAPSAAARPIVDIAGIDISHTIGAGDITSATTSQSELLAWRASSSRGETP